MAKKYYWLKLKFDWFDSKPIKKLRRIAGGDTYTIIYLKMQLLSLKNEGKLYYEGIEENFSDELALDLDEDPENVKVTLKFLLGCGLLEMAETDEYLLTEVPNSIGSETDSAERKRRSRANTNKKLLEEKMGQCHNIVTEVSHAVTNSHTEIDIEIEKEINKEKDKTLCPDLKNSGPQPKVEKESAVVPEPKVEKEPVQEPGTRVEIEPCQEVFITLPLINKTEYQVTLKEVAKMKTLYPAVDVEQEYRNMLGWLESNEKRQKTPRGIKRFINGWLAREQDRGPKPGTDRPKPAVQNRFNNFPQRQYDYGEYEKKLLGLSGQSAKC